MIHYQWADEPPKKLLIVYILDILQKYSDPEHPLTKIRIKQILAEKYSMETDVKAIARNLKLLEMVDNHVKCKEAERINQRGSAEIYRYGFYYKHEFDNAELRLLVDSVMYQMQMPKKTRKDLIDKLIGLSNIYFKNRMKHTIYIPDNAPENISFYKNIRVLAEAINKCKKVCFKYCSYGIDLKLHPRKNADGKERIYTVSPYKLAVKDGKYYLICNYDRYDDICNHRIDRIKGIEMLDAPARPERELNYNEAINLAEYMEKHPYMFSGNIVRARFRAKKYMLNDFVDCFGKNIYINSVGDNEMTVEVIAPESAVCNWAV
ncbi:MAG: WYL domain-containing protein, partial [Oscillospiraceae bacterium]|nr:WYL domain-containing protein [Oscillospiraceae bacterium]